MLTTPLCRDLGIQLPIFNAGMGGGNAGPELAAAVSNAGGLGVLGMGGLPAPAVREAVRATRALTDRPFGVNLLLPLLQGGELEVCLEEKVPVVVFFWGDPSPHLAKAKGTGTKIILQVASAEEAKAAAAQGVFAVMAQGFEAGGHVRGKTSMSVLLPAVVEAVRPLPVIAAGGIADGRGVAAALALGAQAVSLGTRFLASIEAGATDEYKQRVVRARAEDTVHTFLFDVGWPDAAHRVLRNRATDDWEAAGRPATGRRPGEGTVLGKMRIAGTEAEVVKYSVFNPMHGFDGDIEQTALYAGESCSLINDVRPAADIVRDLARGAEAAFRGS
ncbi:MAG: hypothetical protein QOD06_329 [Candidatus Binatota bacterium]|nr:hypothetical protein [Candidatus Binatota bacterium]